MLVIACVLCAALSPTLASKFLGTLSNLSSIVLDARSYLWGLRPLTEWKLRKRQFMRNYWRNTAKVIHGVPSAQLLVWDMYEDPTWTALCDFLQVPVPDVPLPVPLENEF